LRHCAINLSNTGRETWRQQAGSAPAGWLAHWAEGTPDYRAAQPANSIRQAELADELLELIFQYLSGSHTQRDSGYEQ
jgi:hypothetical protein